MKGVLRMNINNDAYGGFVVSKNVINGIEIRYSYREKSHLPVLNGWTISSKLDDDNYVNNPNNFSIINAESMVRIAPPMLEIFDAPYGTDLFWKYENGVLIGFYDLIKDSDTTIDEILRK